MKTPADWQFPAGVNRGLWDYLNDPGLAQTCDQRLAGTPLLQADLDFAQGVFERPGDLIDLGCGTGRALIHLAEQGYRVLGVDLSPEMLRVAQRRAGETGLDISLIRANLVELDALADSCFDQAICLFSTLGMIAGSEYRRQAMRHFARILKPGGRLVLHGHNLWWHLRTRTGRRWLLRDRLSRSPNRGDFEMPAHEGLAGLSLHHFTRRELVRLVRGAGLHILRVQPLGLGPASRLRLPWLFAGFRAYGYLIAAQKAKMDPGSH